MRLLWVIAAICGFWLALLVQPQQCREFTNDHHFASSLLSVVSPNSKLILHQQKQHQETMRGYDINPGFNQDSDEPVHITGFNGLCVSVKNDDYHNGNGIVLNECKDGKENQLWTLRSEDQTIRSKGKCLTTYGYSPGVYVMIYDCKTAAPNATKWKIESFAGNIINPRSGLSLTAEKDDTGMYYLVVDNYNYVPTQVWVPTNDTKPSVTKIASFDLLLCLKLDGVSNVELVKCNKSSADENWAWYLDDTIRPEQHQGHCLRYEYGRHVISVGTCGGWTNERWILMDNDTILHVATGMMMDIKEIPGLYFPYLNCYDKSGTQFWDTTL